MMKKTILYLPFLLALAACGKEPSESEIREAVAKQFANAQAMAGSYGDEAVTDFFDEIVDGMSVDKTGACEQLDEDGDRFACPVKVKLKEIEYNGTRIGPMENEEEAVLFKTDEGWRIGNRQNIDFNESYLPNH